MNEVEQGLLGHWLAIYELYIQYCGKFNAWDVLWTLQEFFTSVKSKLPLINKRDSDVGYRGTRRFLGPFHLRSNSFKVE